MKKCKKQLQKTDKFYGSSYIYNGDILVSFDKEVTEFKMIYRGSE